MSSDGGPARPSGDGQPGERGGGSGGDVAAGGRACLSVLQMRESREREKAHAGRSFDDGVAPRSGGEIGTTPVTLLRAGRESTGKFGAGNKFGAMPSAGDDGIWFRVARTHAAAPPGRARGSRGRDTPLY